MPKPYTPQPDSLAGRVCAFFRANPDEELSQEDIARKWDAPRSAIQSLLAVPVSHNLLQRVQHRNGGSIVYCAGEALLHSPATAAAPAAAAAQPTWPGKTRTSLPPLDVAAFKVIKKEAPPKRASLKTTDWQAFFAQLKVKHDAIEGLPINYYSAAAKASQKWAAANNCKLEMRKQGETFGIYRTT